MKSVKLFYRTFLAVGLSLGIFHTALAEQTENRISIETDPSTFALGGDAIHVRISPHSLARLRVGIGTYSMKFPAVLVDLNTKNKNAGWQVVLRRGYGWFSEYFFNSANQGWLVGGQVALQQFVIDKGDSKLQQQFNNILLMPYVGYRWLHRSGVYVQPWMGIGYTQKVSGSNQILEDTYDIAPLTAFATLHVGYEF